MKKLVLASFTLLLTGCGFFMSGIWKSDPKNWERAFGEKAPAGVVVHQSYYERSPHPIFKEFVYYFEIDDSKAARDYFGFGSTLKLTPLKIAEVDFIRLKDDRADWFPNAESRGDYEVWRFQDGPPLYVVVVDKARRRIFISDRM